MLAVRKTKREVGFELVTIPIPEPDENEVLLKIKAVSLCGTDIHVHDWDPPFCEGRLTPPISTGHEVCGEVIKIGSNVTTLQIGDLVSAESHLPCVSQKDRRNLEQCNMCKMGNGHICEHVKFFSIDTQGFMSEYAVAPANILWKNPPDMKWEIASLLESLGNSVYTVAESNVEGKDVAVFGLGPTGLNSIAVCKKMGAQQIIAVAGTKKHMELAKLMGATTVIDRHNSDPVEEIRKLTDNCGVHVALEMSGNGNALRQSLQAVMTTGMVTILGLYNKPIELDVSKLIVLKDVTMRGIYGRKIWDTWELTSKLLNDGMDISSVITHRFDDLADFPKAVEAMHKGECGKCVFYPNGHQATHD